MCVRVFEGVESLCDGLCKSVFEGLYEIVCVKMCVRVWGYRVD